MIPLLRSLRPQATGPILVAHRGLSSRAPENTLAAVALALDAGADMVEVDVHLSADDEVMVIHDRTLQRTTTGNGPVRSYRSDELAAFDAGSWFDASFARERIPRLQDVLGLISGRALVNVELKSYRGQRNPPGLFERRVVDAVRATGLLGDVVFSSFDHRLVRSLSALEGGTAAGLLYNWHRDLFRRPSTLARGSGASLFICSRGDLRQSFLVDAHAHGMAVFVYTVNSEDEALRLSALGVDGLISDSVDALRPLFPRSR